MNRILLFVLLGLLAQAGELSAQGGYLGRKTAVYVYGDITSYQRFSLYARPWYRHIGVAVGRTVNRNLEVSIAAQVCRGGMYPQAIKSSAIQYSTTGIKEDNMQGYGGKIGFRRFRYTTGSISPIGTYWGMELSVDYHDVNDVFTTQANYTGGPVEVIDYNMTYIKTQVWFKVGWQTILGGHLLIGGEVRTGVLPLTIETTNAESRFFWQESEELLDFEGNTSTPFVSLMLFEFARNVFVPEMHAAFLF